MTRKVVVNTKWGKPHLSHRGLLLARSLSKRRNWFGIKDGGYADLGYELPIKPARHNETLVEVVEQLGEKASAKGTRLVVQEVDHQYLITTEDGIETLWEPKDFNWID